MIRKVVLFLAGLAGIAHETLIMDVERPLLIILFAVMAGVPIPMWADEQRARSQTTQRPEHEQQQSEQPSGADPGSPHT